MMDGKGQGVGNRIAPWRFIVFAATMVVALFAAVPMLGWSRGMMASFDGAALLFLAVCIPLLRDEADEMREAARRNDANRAVLLAISFAVAVVIMVAVASELLQQGKPTFADVALILISLSLSWLFSNTLYALHYAHLFYSRDKAGIDNGGLDFPGTKEPDYSDFIYFAFCLGMTFQTSDTDIKSRRYRRVATSHCLAAFFFNIGVIAFTINVLGSG